MSFSLARVGCVSAITVMAVIHPSCALAQNLGGAAPAAHNHSGQQLTAESDTAVASLLSAACTAAEAFIDRGAAISAGYRRVGMDFPSMGEHWVNPRLVFEGKFDVARPAILTYSVVQGQPALLGVVFAIPLGPGEAPPAAFGPGATWHEHNGSLEEESMLPEHHGMTSSVGGIRLAVLHVWVRAPNPDGVFEAENWALPFIRLGLDVPSGFPKGAARALALLSGGERYFRELGGESANDAIATSLARCADVARRVVSRARAGGQSLSLMDIAELDGAWKAAVMEVGRAVGSGAAKRINGGTLH